MRRLERRGYREHGQQSEQTKAIKRAATDVIWSAGAKTTREERAEVIRRLPPLLKTLRDGMAAAGMSAEKQDEHIQQGRLDWKDMPASGLKPQA